LEECYQAEEEDSLSLGIISSSTSTTRPPIISELDKISVLLNGLPPAYQTVIVNITGISLAYLSFEDVITRLMNEEGRLRNAANTPTTSPDAHDQAFSATALRLKGKSPKSAPSKDMSKVRCHKCGGVGHYRSDCPTQDSDAANVADDEDDKESESTFSVITEEIAW